MKIREVRIVDAEPRNVIAVYNAESGWHDPSGVVVFNETDRYVLSRFAEGRDPFLVLSSGKHVYSPHVARARVIVAFEEATFP